MKLLLVFAFLALVCLARSAPAAPTTPSRGRELILPDYADEIVINEDDLEDDTNSTTTTTTTTTRRSTYTFPTRNRITPSSRRPWLPERTSTRKTKIITDDIHDNDNKYLKHIKKYFKEMWDDIKSFIRRLTGYDLIKAIQQFFNKKNED